MEISLENLYVDVGLKEPRLWYKSPETNSYCATRNQRGEHVHAVNLRDKERVP